MLNRVAVKEAYESGRAAGHGGPGESVDMAKLEEALDRLRQWLRRPVHTGADDPWHH